jgi:hypothetical protein
MLTILFRYRYLRSMDRSLNADVYPKLNYPEMYLLDGGYKNFYNQFSVSHSPLTRILFVHSLRIISF